MVEMPQALPLNPELGMEHQKFSYPQEWVVLMQIYFFTCGLVEWLLVEQRTTGFTGEFKFGP